MSDSFGGSPGQIFQQEKVFEKQVAQKLLSNMRAVLRMRAGRDRQFDGLLSDLPPPPELTEAKVFLRYRMATSRSKELKRVIAFILKFIIKPLLDLFQPDPIIMSSYWKEKPSSSNERGVILAPDRMVGREEEEPEDSVLRSQTGMGPEDIENSIDNITPGGEESDVRELSFVGPEGSEDSDIQDEE